MIRKKVVFLVLLAALVLGLIGFVPGDAQAQRGRRKRLGKVCGDPTVRCVTSVEFQPYDLPFQIPATGAIWESEKYYAVMLKSQNAKDNCDNFVSEDERLETQALFPHSKVFTDRCGEPGNVFYTNTNSHYRFMAVYAGKTLAQAQAMRARAIATGKFPQANVRRMAIGFNGT